MDYHRKTRVLSQDTAWGRMNGFFVGMSFSHLLVKTVECYQIYKNSDYRKTPHSSELKDLHQFKILEAPLALLKSSKVKKHRLFYAIFVWPLRCTILCSRAKDLTVTAFFPSSNLLKSSLKWCVFPLLPHYECLPKDVYKVLIIKSCCSESPVV